MAQLSEDCFAFGGALCPVDKALSLIEEKVQPVVENERVALSQACGRILAQDLVAPFDLPPHANSAVDGYALAFADLSAESETVLPVTGLAAAGHPLARPFVPGEAIRIFTGAAMPEGADTVMMQEDCVVERGFVRLKPGLRKGANRREAGEDVTRGTIALCAGRRLLPADLGLAAALGCRELEVRRALRVALLSNGDELFEPGTPLPAGAIYDSNRHLLKGLLRGLGAAVSDLGILPDREAALREALLSAAGEHDLIVASGGMSSGEEDHMKRAVESCGSLHFWRLAIKPGRPVAMGQVGSVPFLGLPGNPVAVAVTFIVLARPFLFRLAGALAPSPLVFRVRAAFSYRKKKGRREYLRGRLRGEGKGLLADRYPVEGAGILSSIVRSDGLLILDEATTAIDPGEEVDFLPFSEVLW